MFELRAFHSLGLAVLLLAPLALTPKVRAQDADPTLTFIGQADSVLAAGGEEALATWLEGRDILVGAAAATVLDIAVQLGDAGDAANEEGNVAFVRALAEAQELRGADSPARRALVEYESWDGSDRAARRSAAALRAAADSVRAAGDPDAAVEFLQRADQIYLEIGDTHSRAIVAGSLGVAHWYRGDFDAVEAAYLRALELRREVGDTILEGKTLNGMGSMNFARGEYAQAVQWYERAAELRRRTGDLAGLGTSLTYAGHAHLQLSEVVAARKLYEQALPVLRAVGSTSQVVENLIGTADLYDMVGRYRDAIDTYREAVRLCESDSGCESLALALQNLSTSLRNAGQLREAMVAIEQADQATDATTDPVTATRIALNWSYSALDLGMEDLAKEKARAALGYARQTQDVGLQCDAQNSLASLLLNLGNYDRARGAASAALELATGLGDLSRQREAQALLGGAKLREGKGESAASAFTAALALDESRGLQQNMAEDLLGRGGAWSVAGDAERAREDLRRAGSLLRESDASSWQWLVQLNLADTFEKSDPDSAAHWYGLALEALDASARGAGDAALNSGYLFADRGRAYEGILAFYAQQYEKDPEGEWEARAYDVAERSRARGLLELLEHSLDANTSPATAAVIDSLYGVDGAQPDARDERRRLEGRLAELRQLSLGRAGARHPATLAEVQKALPLGTVLLQYSLGDSNSWMWVVEPGHRALHRLPGREDLERRVRALRDGIAQPGAGDSSVRREGYELYRILLEPARQQWEHAASCVIVADGVLLQLPFEVLLTGETDSATSWSEAPFVARRLAPVYAPSATVFLRLLAADHQAPAKSQALLAVGDVDYSGQNSGLAPLPFTRAEVESIRPSGRSSTLLLADDATETKLKAALSDSPPEVLHLAAHGLIDGIEPARSSIALTPDAQDDGEFYSLEILATPLPGCLVVLSACESALGRQTAGEGVVGLTRSFLAAGARAVVASMWSVADESTAELMKDFYTELWRGRTSSQSLRHARLTLLGSDRWAHPVYWAPFVVIGEGGALR